MKRKVSELEGALLDAAVAKATGDDWRTFGQYRSDVEHAPYSSCWEFGGPLIERERVTILAPDERLDQLTFAIWNWTAAKYLVDDDEDEIEFEQEGPTPLIAAMRAYVASKFGEEVELP